MRCYYEMCREWNQCLIKMLLSRLSSNLDSNIPGGEIFRNERLIVVIKNEKKMQINTKLNE